MKDLQSVDRAWRLRVQQIIEDVEAAKSLRDLRNVKKMSGGGPYYRIRLTTGLELATIE